MTHICVSRLTIIGSDNGLLPDRRHTTIWTNVGIFSIGHMGTNFSEILIEICRFSFKEMYFKMSSEKWRFCLGLSVLKCCMIHTASDNRHQYKSIYLRNHSHWNVCFVVWNSIYFAKSLMPWYVSKIRHNRKSTPTTSPSYFSWVPIKWLIPFLANSALILMYDNCNVG